MELTVTNRRSAQFLIHFQETKDDELQGLLATTSHLDLTAPMPGCAVGQRRHLLLEGDLKMREGSSSKVVNIFGCESSPISRNVRSCVRPSVRALVDKCKLRPIKAQ